MGVRNRSLTVHPCVLFKGNSDGDKLTAINSDTKQEVLSTKTIEGMFSILPVIKKIAGTEDIY